MWGTLCPGQAQPQGGWQTRCGVSCWGREGFGERWGAFAQGLGVNGSFWDGGQGMSPFLMSAGPVKDPSKAFPHPPEPAAATRIRVLDC